MRVEALHPPLNAMLSMNPWKRLSAKGKIQDAFASALSGLEPASATRMVLLPSGGLTASGMLESFRTTLQTLQKSSKGSAGPKKVKRRTRILR